jgi:hypothetical protein
MGVNLSYLDDNQGVEFSCYGVSVGAELKEALRRLGKKEFLENLKYAIIDETEVSSYIRMGSDTEDFVSIQKYLGTTVPDDAIVAVVAPLSVGYDLAVLWEKQVSVVGWVTKVFKDRAEAQTWVKQKVKDLFDIDIDFRSKDKISW